MTWTTFGLWLSLAYLAWYGLNLAFDMLISSKSADSGEHQQELFFEEASAPELVAYLADSPAEDLPSLGGTEIQPKASLLKTGLVQATGALSIAELLIRAKDELIEHTRAIPY
uniref:hypothetical protein n=1 Tax=Pedobacter schmidteae TaxID=2201271 RepID=UPI000EB1460B|nr:hypothetical protein [Pedobacter schmidteae]